MLLFGCIWDHVVVIWESCWDLFGIILGSFAFLPPHSYLQMRGLLYMETVIYYVVNCTGKICFPRAIQGHKVARFPGSPVLGSLVPWVPGPWAPGPGPPVPPVPWALGPWAPGPYPRTLWSLTS